MELLRSLIFVPGNRADMLDKARAFDADVIVADLEDSVPASEKLHARQLVNEKAHSLSEKGQKLVVRINSLDTGLSRDDLSAAMGTHLWGISVGKVESTWDINEYDRIIRGLEKQEGLEHGQVKLIPWIENARAVMSARDIAASSPRVVAVAFGAEDYTNDIGIQRTDVGDEVYFPKAAVALAARAAGVLALDGPHVTFSDLEALTPEVELDLKLGYKGKFAIHPAQLETINTMFSPRHEEVQYARRVLEAWDLAEATGRGSTSLDGRMIDVPVVKRARNLLALADAIAEKKGRNLVS